MIKVASITKLEKIVTPLFGYCKWSEKGEKGFRGNRFDVPASCAAVYTTNQIQAAPLQVTKDSITAEGKLQAIIVNSGNANACTGMQGLQDAYEMRALGAEHFGVKENYVAVASTGVIGVPLPMDIIRKGLQLLYRRRKKVERILFLKQF